jgi:hypothetical protein
LCFIDYNKYQERNCLWYVWCMNEYQNGNTISSFTTRKQDLYIAIEQIARVVQLAIMQKGVSCSVPYILIQYTPPMAETDIV